jgi:hypothetical protein
MLVNDGNRKESNVVVPRLILLLSAHLVNHPETCPLHLASRWGVDLQDPHPVDNNATGAQLGTSLTSASDKQPKP